MKERLIKALEKFSGHIGKTFTIIDEVSVYVYTDNSISLCCNFFTDKHLEVETKNGDIVQIVHMSLESDFIKELESILPDVEAFEIPKVDNSDKILQAKLIIKQQEELIKQLTK